MLTQKLSSPLPTPCYSEVRDPNHLSKMQVFFLESAALLSEQEVQMFLKC